jgi:hypothetical protein
MKLLISRRRPNSDPQIVPDEDYEEMKRNGLAKRYTVTEITPIKIIPKIVIPAPEVKRAKKVKNND